MGSSNQYVVFILDEQRFALRLIAVERVVRAAEITPLPGAPKIVLGVINVSGQIIPVFDPRRRFGMPVKEIDLSDHLIIALSRERRVALLVDALRGVHESSGEDTVASERILPAIDHIEGVVKLEGGLIFIHDLDEFLSLDEEKTLDTALKIL